jgi:hypothetical protein
MEEATEIAKLRLFLAMVASVRRVEELEPLPNIDFNILPGNSLVGLMRVDEHEFDHKQDDLFKPSFRHLLDEKNRKLSVYRNTAQLMGQACNLRGIRDDIDQAMQQAGGIMNELLQDRFKEYGIKVEQAVWDTAKGALAKPAKRAVTLADIELLHPFHWGYVFDEIMQKRGGFDIIITNPPWEIVKPQAKEFFQEHSGLVSKNKMTIKEFEKEQDKLLKDAEIRAAWLEYLSRFPHLSAWFRAAPQFRHQSAIVGGKKTGSDINLYKLFTEQCANLLRDGGECGIVIPSGIYTDLGAKGLRDLLFDENRVTGLFCFENRKTIFEGVDSRFKFVVLTFEKGGGFDSAQPAGRSLSGVEGNRGTVSFPTPFLGHDVAELERFPDLGALELSVDLIRRLSPDSHSLMEFKSALDIRIAEKMLKFPLLGEKLEGIWNIGFTAEFHMTNDSRLFKAEPAQGRLPLYEGKMIHQFNAAFENPRYWVDYLEGRTALLGRTHDEGQKIDSQTFRLGFRDIARNTDERTMISTIIPSAFHGNKLPTVRVFEDGKRILSNNEQLFICAVWNSFVIDFMLRMKVTTTLNFFYIYQLPVPRLTEKDTAFRPIVERAARLICTTPEFDRLAKEAGIGSHTKGVTNEVERRRLRAELDGLVAHLYGLTEAEFAHILTTFPLVADPVKIAAQNAYRDVERGLVK